MRTARGYLGPYCALLPHVPRHRDLVRHVPPVVVVSARGLGDVRLRTHVSYDNVKTIFQHVAYEIRGNAAYDTPVGRMTFPVSVMR
jgi:hypothetical protein